MNSDLKVKIIIFLVSLVCVVLFSSCGTTAGQSAGASLQPALPILDAAEVKSKDEICTGLVNGQIDAWRSKDKANLEKIYTEDIVHYDGGPWYIGIGEVTKMAHQMWILFGPWEMKAGEAYISEDHCMGEWVNWNVFRITEEDPATEYDWLEYEDGRISFWRLFYDQKFQDEFGASDRIHTAFLEQFAETWTSQDTGAIASLYSTEGQIEDTLFGVSVKGTKKIADFAEAYSNQFPGAAWRLVDPFAEEEAGKRYKEEYPFTYQGGVYAVKLPQGEDSACELRLIVLLAPDDEGNILNQKVFYEAQSLIDCGLAE